jgi:hypothetical protein
MRRCSGQLKGKTSSPSEPPPSVIGRTERQSRAFTRALGHYGHAPMGRTRRSWAAWASPPKHCGTRPHTLWSQAKRAVFSRELGRATGNQPRAGFGNLKFLFHFPGYFKSIETSKIHIKINIHPKFMKLVSIFF